MKQTRDGLFLLSRAELKSLIQASQDKAAVLLQDPLYDPNDNGLPYFVNRGHELLFGTAFFTEEQLDGKPVREELREECV